VRIHHEIMIWFMSHHRTPPNRRSALDARTALCFHIKRHWPGASESERWP
jgi:hypothetical protein